MEGWGQGGRGDLLCPCDVTGEAEMDKVQMVKGFRQEYECFSEGRQTGSVQNLLGSGTGH